jgi:glycine cleavage system H protein
MEDDKTIEYNDQLWAIVHEDVVTIGVKQEVFEDINEVWGVDLPTEGDEVNPEEICGEVETDDGPINLYSPIEGEVIDVNKAVQSDFDLLYDDSNEEGWLFKVKSSNSEDLEQFLSENSDSDDGLEEI